MSEGRDIESESIIVAVVLSFILSAVSWFLLYISYDDFIASEYILDGISRITNLVWSQNSLEKKVAVSSLFVSLLLFVILVIKFYGFIYRFKIRVMAYELGKAKKIQKDVSEASGEQEGKKKSNPNEDLINHFK